MLIEPTGYAGIGCTVMKNEQPEATVDERGMSFPFPFPRLPFPPPPHPHLPFPPLTHNPQTNTPRKTY